MAIDFNTAPYFDDFDKTKKYYRILFKPGRSVQARELTQLQTILQNQIEQFGKNIFKDGALITGGRSFLGGGLFLKVATSDVALSTFDKTTIVGTTSNARAIVRLYDDERTIDNVVYPKTLYVAVVSGKFVAGEEITIENTTTSATLETGTFAGPVIFFSIDESIFFTKGHFVYCAPQTIVLSRTFENQPSARVGLEISEGIYTSDENPDLLDPAVGASNYFAPGADRYYIDLTLKAITYDPDVEGSDSTTIKEFIEVANLRRGSIISLLRNTAFNVIEDTLARRTFDESGDYTVTPFIAKVRDHVYGNVEKLTVEISPGKAYVKGYEFETIAPTYVTMDRARDYETVTNFPFTADYGRYIIVNGVGGHFNTHNSQVVHFADEKYGNLVFTSNAAYFANVIGSGRVRYFEHDSGATSTYKLYLFDVKMLGSNVFANTVSVVAVNGDNVSTTSNVLAFANIYGNAVITYGTDDSLLFRLPQKKIKTFSNTTITAQRVVSKTFTVSSGNATATINSGDLGAGEYLIGSGTLSDDAINSRFFAAVTSTADAANVALYSVVPLYGTQGNVHINSPTSATLTVIGNTQFTANIVFLTTTVNESQKSKALANSSVIVPSTGNVYNISLGVSDVVGITSITDYLGNSYLGSYELDTGQRDDYYDYGRVILKRGAVPPALNATTNPNVTVAFQYFTHSGTSYFDVDSYGAGSGISYSEIPVYVNNRGEQVSLTDAIDFRPVRPAASNSLVSVKLIQPGSTSFSSYEYYLARLDKLVLTKDRNFKIVKGISSTSPVLPQDLSDGMTLYSFSLPAYTADFKDVTTRYYEHKRYTMRDIGKIEKRVERVEYYTSLSLLEKIAADEKIISDLTGIDRFKNGILVDPFAGHSVGDVRNGDYRCAIDPVNRTLRPLCTSESYGYFLDTSASSNFTRTGDLVTLPYNSASYITQLKATRTVFLTPFEVFNWTGRMTLDPATDVWADTLTSPSVTVNLNGENDAFTQIVPDSTGLTPYSTQWNNWQTVFRGVTDVGVGTSSTTTVSNETTIDSAGNITVTPTARTETTTSTTLTTAESQLRTGIQLAGAQKTITNSLGTKVVDSSIVPFIRSRPVKFVAKGLKPNTRLYASFDGVDVTDYCRDPVKIKFTNNNIPTANLTLVTHSSGWTGDIISVSGTLGEIRVIPNTAYPLPLSGNVLAFANTAITANIDTVTVPNGPAEIITDSTGAVSGLFIIPNNAQLKFNIGERAFRLADSLNSTFATTVAETKYLAYGISNTKQDTILATRVNLTSITPLSETTTTSLGTTTRTTTDQGVRTTGTGNTVSLPPTQQVYISNNTIINNVTNNTINNVVVNNPGITNSVQTLFCGAAINSSGNRGYHTFNLKLGNTLGSGNVVVSSGSVPARFTLEYAGTSQTTGFMTSEASASANAVVTANEQLKLLTLPEVTTFNGTNVKLGFNKLAAVDETAVLKVDSPLEGAEWSFTLDCPATYTPPVLDSGSAELIFNANGDSPTALLQFFPRLWGGQTRTTANISGHIYFTIRNTASNPGWSTGSGNGAIIVNGITATKPTDSAAGVDVTVVTSGTVATIVDGTYEFIDNAGSPTESLTLGSLPVTLQPGQAGKFAVRIDKTAEEFINGGLTVATTITGPTGNVVPCNDVVVPFSTSILTDTWIEDPIAQTFFVQANETPDGVFISSIDAFFYEKDSKIPVSCEIRPTVNGYPSSYELIPFATVTVDADDVVTSATPDDTKYTRFTFPSPIFLPPGQYCFVLRSPSNKYRAYTAVLGEFDLANPDERITKQAYIGSLFKSQNAVTWTAEQNEDLMFRINRCSFTRNTTATVNLKAKAPSNNVEFDVYYTSGELVNFAKATTAFAYKTTSNASGSTDVNFINYNLGFNAPMAERKVLKKNNSTTLQLQGTMSTTSTEVSPVLDLARMESVLVRNVINNDSTGEADYFGGNAKARYITRKVTLNPGFEGTDLKVYFNAYCPSNSSVKVYYKVNAPGTTQFDAENKYVEMTDVTISGNQRAGFGEYTVGTANGECLSGGEKFNTFTIKIVMLSDNPVYVPIIRDLRVVALDE